ncbi:MAG: hypothetical protein LH609_00920 [Rudanella sp.]|nr:hypothetical protein [Rudanella sp.]
MKTHFLISALLVTLLFSCDPTRIVRYETASISTDPVNLAELNTPSNDYNSAGPPTLIMGMPFFFSSDRPINPQSFSQPYALAAKGKFDVLGYRTSLFFNQNSGTWRWQVGPSVSAGSDRYPPSFAYSVLQQMNTSANELGPYIHMLNASESDLFMNSSDSTGNLDIYFMSYPKTCIDCSLPFPKSERMAATRLNSDKDDAYPTLTADNTQLLFTSNRNGSFDLFSVDVSGQPIKDALIGESTSGKSPQLIPSLNSPADDKCPYINGSLLVFTSNRPGGYGGYDLYYSRWINGQWSAPVNFGPAINSSADEYRPVAFRADMFENNLMIFSSNRSGGQGGFDLYYVGIPKALINP